MINNERFRILEINFKTAILIICYQLYNLKNRIKDSEKSFIRIWITLSKRFEKQEK